MRRMKIEPMTFYPVTELYDTTGDYVAFLLNRDITKKLKSSPNAIHLLVETTVAGYQDHGGAIEFKMMPAKGMFDDNLICAYLDAKVTDNNQRIIAYCYLHNDDDQAMVYLALNNFDGTAVTNYGDIFNNRLRIFESSGYGLENMINVAIEPVSISISVLSSEI